VSQTTIPELALVGSSVWLSVFVFLVSHDDFVISFYRSWRLQAILIRRPSNMRLFNSFFFISPTLFSGSMIQRPISRQGVGGEDKMTSDGMDFAFTG
jgi:hypothetical protein